MLSSIINIHCICTVLFNSLSLWLPDVSRLQQASEKQAITGLNKKIVRFLLVSRILKQSALGLNVQFNWIGFLQVVKYVKQSCWIDKNVQLQGRGVTAQPAQIRMICQYKYLEIQPKFDLSREYVKWIEYWNMSFRVKIIYTYTTQYSMLTCKWGLIFASVQEAYLAAWLTAVDVPKVYMMK